MNDSDKVSPIELNEEQTEMLMNLSKAIRKEIPADADYLTLVYIPTDKGMEVRLCSSVGHHVYIPLLENALKNLKLNSIISALQKTQTEGMH